ncbi:hypothetical protein M0534_03555 [Methylonatrum kenyense]|uniref:hypothetical protein n=1 Tax=Methylonatrum kenyense TaxID=455253 RepID=UPI0020BF4772|nr:hypothetical protein [Methylonatrum kenyense]MCK8515412.1 hypothetical protein [Methylonatrum kenyense]
MKRFSLVALLMASLGFAATALAENEAHDYPTIDRYQWIEECMYFQGERNFETLYACACAIDVIAEHMPHEKFVQADTAEKAATVSGESGEYLREPARNIQELRLAYGEAKNEADKRCFVRPNRLRNIWPEF